MSLHRLFKRIVALVFTGAVVSCNELDAKRGESVGSGLALYETNCAVCHQKEGEGLNALYPALKNSDYLKQNARLLPCIIHQGLEGKIHVGGVSFEQPMPAFPSLSEKDVADISNYVLVHFARLNTFYDPADISAKWNCR